MNLTIRKSFILIKRTPRSYCFETFRRFVLVSMNVPWTHLGFWIGPIIIAAILALLMLPFSSGRWHAFYKKRFQDTRRERLFLASLGFFVSVFVIRGITLAIHYNVGPFMTSPCMAAISITWFGVFCFC